MNQNSRRLGHRCPSVTGVGISALPTVLLHGRLRTSGHGGDELEGPALAAEHHRGHGRLAGSVADLAARWT